MIIAEIDELSFELQVFIDGFLSLYTHDLLNGVFDVENKVVLSEFVTFNLSKIKQVLNDEVH